MLRGLVDLGDTVPFNLETLEVSGDPVQVMDGVAHGDAGAAEYSYSNDGLLIYRPAGSRGGGGGALALVDRAGRSLPFHDPVPTGRTIGGPAVSPGGGSLAGVIDYELWVLDLLRGSSTRLTAGTRAWPGAWSPDGKLIAYAEERNSPWNPYVRRADGSEPGQILFKSETSLIPMSWSPDGRWILMVPADPERGEDIVTLALADKTIKPFVVTDHNELAGRFSPDGKWVAYTSDESDRAEIYVRPFEEEEGRWQISTQGSDTPYWKKPDEIIFQSGRKVMSVHIRTSPAFSAEPPRLLFEGPNDLLDVMPDGDRFLVRQAGESGKRDASLRLVAGWFSEVVRKTGK